MRFLLVIIFFIFGGFTFAPSGLMHKVQIEKEDTIIIQKHSSSNVIATILCNSGIISHPYGALIGILALKFMGKALKSGEYCIEPSKTLWQVLNQISEGKVVKHLLTIPEGLTVYEIAQKISDIEILTGNIAELPVEGSLLPQTYDYYYDDSRELLLKRMQKAMDNLKEKLLNASSNNSLSWDEVLVLASIVEKETAIAHERPIVASVYLNRMAIGMPLQADPTVIYAITNGKTSFPRPLSRADLKTASPYNTYVNKALPPTPIACPGEESIKAVLDPSNTNFIYFVANGDGGHQFSENLKDHNANVKKWKSLKAARKGSL